MKPILLIAIVSGTLCAVRPAQTPITWRSKGLRVSTSDNVIYLEQAVEIKHGKTSVRADSGRIYFDPSDKRLHREAITRVVLHGNVRFSLGGERFSGRGEHAELLPQESITLSGQVTAHRGDSTIRGTRVIYYLNTGWIKVSDAQGELRSERTHSKSSR